MPHVLLLGGHGKVSLLLTPLILSKGWTLTSVIRDAAQKIDILEAAKQVGNIEGKLDVLVASLEDVKSKQDAKKIIEQTKPVYVVWSAGMFILYPAMVFSVYYY